MVSISSHLIEVKLDELLSSNFASYIEWKVQNDFRVLLFQTFVSEVVQVKNRLKYFIKSCFNLNIYGEKVGPMLPNVSRIWIILDVGLDL